MGSRITASFVLALVTLVVSNNFLGNDCGIHTSSSGQIATGNYWGSPSGPGPGQVCNGVDTTAFLRAPAAVNVTGGR